MRAPAVSSPPVDVSRPAAPGGTPPPSTQTGPAGDELDLVALAGTACERYHREFADEFERYGEDVARQWCVHDLQHLLNWAALDVQGVVTLNDQVAWLAKVLEARSFPLERLARGLGLAADVVREQVSGGDAMAAKLADAARMVRERGSFLPG
jgi:hypothetical protein